MLEPPLTKSGVAYRMRKLESFAAEILRDLDREGKGLGMKLS